MEANNWGEELRGNRDHAERRKNFKHKMRANILFF